MYLICGAFWNAADHIERMIWFDVCWKALWFAYIITLNAFGLTSAYASHWDSTALNTVCIHFDELDYMISFGNYSDCVYSRNVMGILT